MSRLSIIEHQSAIREAESMVRHARIVGLPVRPMIEIPDRIRQILERFCEEHPDCRLVIEKDMEIREVMLSYLDKEGL